MANVYVEPRPKGRPEGDPITLTMLSRIMPITSWPASRRSTRQSSGRRRTATSRMSRASDT